MHAEHSADVYFAGAGKKAVTHHAHDGAGDDAEVFFDGGPTLHGADGDFSVAHPLVYDRTQLCHLHECDFGDAAGIDVFLDGGEFALRNVVVVFHAFDTA